MTSACGRLFLLLVFIHQPSDPVNVWHPANCLTNQSRNLVPMETNKRRKNLLCVKPWILFFSTAVFCRYFFSVWNQVIFFSGEFFFFWNVKTFRRFLLFLLYSVFVGELFIFFMNAKYFFNLQNQKKNSGDFFFFLSFFHLFVCEFFFPNSSFLLIFL